MLLGTGRGSYSPSWEPRHKSNQTSEMWSWSQIETQEFMCMWQKKITFKLCTQPINLGAALVLLGKVPRAKPIKLRKRKVKMFQHHYLFLCLWRRGATVTNPSWLLHRSSFVVRPSPIPSSDFQQESAGICPWSGYMFILSGNRKESMWQRGASINKHAETGKCSRVGKTTRQQPYWVLQVAQGH